LSVGHAGPASPGGGGGGAELELEQAIHVSARAGIAAAKNA
jgi:hypothetical protein